MTATWTFENDVVLLQLWNRFCTLLCQACVKRTVEKDADIAAIYHRRRPDLVVELPTPKGTYPVTKLSYSYVDTGSDFVSAGSTM